MVVGVRTEVGWSRSRSEGRNSTCMPESDNVPSCRACPRSCPFCPDFSPFLVEQVSGSIRADFSPFSIQVSGIIRADFSPFQMERMSGNSRAYYSPFPTYWDSGGSMTHVGRFAIK